MTTDAPVQGSPARAGNWTDFSDEISEVLLAELDPSPFNARVIREDDSLRELAESIKRFGVQQPIIIREVPLEGEVVSREIVCGHRRFRASQLAGRETIPAITRDLSDDEARELQITENLQRTDLPPLEEAMAFSEAMTAAAHKTLSVQELAAHLGKSPVYINRRLMLLGLIPAAKDALSQGLIEVGHALELARLTAEEQHRLCVWLEVVDEESLDEDELPDDWSELNSEEDEGEVAALDTGGRVTTRSVVELRKYINRTTLHVLGDAPFDPNDSWLVEKAGSCATCLMRSGASPLLFSDVRGEDVCADRACYDEKVKAYIKKRIADAKTSGEVLHRLTSIYGAKGENLHYLYSIQEIDDKPCASMVEAIHIDGSKIGKVVTICVDKSCKVHYLGVSNSSLVGPEAKEKRKALLAKVKVEKTYRLELFKALLAKQIDPIPTDQMVKSLAVFALGMMDSTKHEVVAELLGWHKETFGWQQRDKAPLARLNAVSNAEAIRIALVALEANELTVHEYDIERKNNSGKFPEIGLERMARMLGVDAAAIRARVDPASVPAPKKAVAKKAAKKAPVKKAQVKKAVAKKAVAKKAAKKAPVKKAQVKKAVAKKKPAAKKAKRK